MASMKVYTGSDESIVNAIENSRSLGSGGTIITTTSTPVYKTCRDDGELVDLIFSYKENTILYPSGRIIKKTIKNGKTRYIAKVSVWKYSSSGYGFINLSTGGKMNAKVGHSGSAKGVLEGVGEESLEGEYYYANATTNGTINLSCVYNGGNLTDPDGDDSTPNGQLNGMSSISASGSMTSIETPLDEKMSGIFYPTDWSQRNSSIAAQDYEEAVTDGDINIEKLRGIFGMPYQFLPSTDCRLDFYGNDRLDDYGQINKIGLTYADMLMSKLPLLFITPGNTAFMSTSGNKRKALMGDVTSFLASGDTSQLDNLMDNYSGKLYSIEPKYSEYFNYVNVMCRSGAIFLGLNNYEGEYGKLDGIPLVNYNWAMNDGGDYFTAITDDEGNVLPEENNKNSDEQTKSDQPTSTAFADVSSAGRKFQSFIYYRSAIPFYVNSDVSFTDTLGNETTESTLASAVNGLSDKAREIQFLLGTATSQIGSKFDSLQETLARSRQEVDNLMTRLGDTSSNIFGTLFKSVKTIISGGRLIFPNIWSNSTFSKSYNITIRLTTPEFDPKSWFLNIYVPLCHLIALVLPRGEFQNGYTTPFIIKAFYKGMFNIDMGIITDMNISKGKDGGWTKDALPTVVEVQFTIQDLYSQLSMTKDGDMYKHNTLQNVSELDYLANLCGVNINQPDTFRMIEMWYTMNIENKFIDIPSKIITGLENTITNKINNIFSNF